MVPRLNDRFLLMHRAFKQAVPEGKQFEATHLYQQQSNSCGDKSFPAPVRHCKTLQAAAETWRYRCRCLLSVGVEEIGFSDDTYIRSR